MTGGTEHYYSDRITYKTSSTIDGGWVRISMSFTPAHTGVFSISVYGEDCVGTFYADDFQLEEGNAPSNRNMLDNGSIQDGSSEWTMGSGASYTGGTGVPSDSSDSRSIQIVGDPDTECKASQTVKLVLPVRETYVLSGWGKADAVPDNVQTASSPAEDRYKQFGLRAVLTYSDGTTESFYAPFNPALTGWQFTSLTIVPSHTSGKVQSIRVECAYERNANTAYFDNLSLVREAAQTMRYDADGNLVSVTSTGQDETGSEYDSGDLIRVFTGGSGDYEFSYDSAHRVSSVTDGILTENLTYNSSGNVTGTTVTGGGQSIVTSATYAGNGDRLYTSTDSRGYVTEYQYSAVGSATSTEMHVMLGAPGRVVNPEQTTVYTTYDDLGWIHEKWIAGAADVVYTYTNGNLTKIRRIANGAASQAQEYNLTYDGMGNLTKVQVGSHELGTYTYSTASSRLTRQTYGNDATVDFSYDNLDRVVETTYSGGRTLSYVYTGDGQLSSMQDSGTGVTCHYLYDTLGRLIGSHSSNGIHTAYEYDTHNRLKKRDYAASGFASGAERYTYNTDSSDAVPDGALTSMTMVTGGTIAYTYDALERLSEKTIAGMLEETYSFATGAGANTTTNLVSGKRTKLNGSTVLNETVQYNSVGNISRIENSTGGTSVEYTYDSQGQLLTATHKSGSTVTRTETYSYDGVGNLQSFSNGSRSHNYTYGDGDWKDLLTAVDGQTITYDGAGNPLSYYDGYRYTLTWSEGRRLASLTYANKTTRYEYNADGIRTKKFNADGTYVVYHLADGRAIGETVYAADGSVVRYMRYAFDESDSVIGFSLWVGGWKHYYFVKNLQGDVVRIYKASDNSLAASYTYDSWGNVLSATGELATINPFRYRGYYYDNESWFYYLQSRYYDPAIGRFINADVFTSTGQDFVGYNMFAYCGNNPVLRKDSGGEFWNIAAGAIIGGVLSAVTQIAANIATGNKWSSGVVTAAVSGAASGALSSTGLGKVGQAIGNAAISFVGETINQISSGTFGTKEGSLALAKATGAGFIGGLIGGNGMRHKSSNYYKAAQNAKDTALKVFGKTYGNSRTPAKLLSRAAKMVQSVGYEESFVTGVKFIIGGINAQVLTRIGTE